MLATVLPVRAQSPWRQLDLVPPTAEGHAVVAAGPNAVRFNCVAACPGDTNLLLAAYDTGGVFRSRDGGKSWELAMTGWQAQGASGFVFDPVNPARVLGIATGRAARSRSYGLYESMDAGATWRQLHVSDVPWQRTPLFDSSSYSRSVSACLRAWAQGPDGVLWRSTDGGHTWHRLNRLLSAPLLAIQPGGRRVYLASAHPSNPGVWRSFNGGNTFRREIVLPVQAIAVSPAAPDLVWIIQGHRLLVSRNMANSFAAPPDIGLPGGVAEWKALTVSPHNASHLLAAATDGRTWFSLDGGASWAHLPGVRLSGGPFDHLLVHSWGWLTNGLVSISGQGGLWAGRLNDGVFQWKGVPGPQPIVDGGFHFHPESDAVLLALRDAQTVLSVDGGKTWQLRRVDHSAPHRPMATALTADGRRLLVAHAEPGGGRRLHVSPNGGDTWVPVRDPALRPIRWSGQGDIIVSHPTNALALFAPGWRSLDGGASWGATPSCQVVYTAGALPPHPLLGRLDTTLMLSTNLGASWGSLTPVLGGFTDVALDQRSERVFLASQNTLKVLYRGQWTTPSTPADQHGRRHIQTVAIDPANPNVLYAGGRAPDYVTSVPVIRSLDGGRTWHSLIPKRDDKFLPGPREVTWLRVHPKTRELWVATEGFGVWVASPP